MFFPNQDDRGTHVNVSGAGVVKTAPNQDNAVKLLEYLASPEAQRYFADVSLEYPANPEVEAAPRPGRVGRVQAGHAQRRRLYAKNSAEAAMITDRCGWK